MAWPTLPFPETIRKTSVGRRNQIPASQIKPVGRFPVVDQGQSFIAGYSDDESRLIKCDLPLVVFGDHTRVVKFVDFPFILGADGTKVLKPREESFDAMFFAFALQNLNLPSRGYNRHFTLLKESHLPRPQLTEQLKIAAVLELIHQALEQEERLATLTTTFKNSLLHKMFTRGLCEEPRKQSEVGLIPQSWEAIKVSELITRGVLAKPLDGNHGSIHPKSSDFVSTGIPFIMASDLKDGTIDFESCVYLRKEQADQLQKGFAREGDVLISHKGTIGVTAVVPHVADYVMLTPQVTYYRITDPDVLNATYLKALFDSPFFQTQFKQIAMDGSTRDYIGITKQADLYLLVPRIGEQQQIAETIRNVELKLSLHLRKHAMLSALFRTILHQLMSAQVRVNYVEMGNLDTLV